MHSTFHGLCKWYKHQFETLGWMVLAEQNDPEKIKEYRRGVQKMIQVLDERMNLGEQDKMTDLRIMKENSQILLAHIDKDYFSGRQGEQKGGVGRRNSRRNSRRGSKRNSRRNF
jgi:hypothetical protein